MLKFTKTWLKYDIIGNLLFDKFFLHLLDWLLLNVLAIGDGSDIQLGLLPFFTLAYVSMR